MSLSIGDVSASGPFFTCPKRAARSRALAPQADSAEGAWHSRTSMKSLRKSAAQRLLNMTAYQGSRGARACRPQELASCATAASPW